MDDKETVIEEDDDAVDDRGRFDPLFVVSVGLFRSFGLDFETEEDLLLVVDFCFGTFFVVLLLGAFLTSFLPEVIETELSKEEGDSFDFLGILFRVLPEDADGCCCCWRSFWKGEVAPPKRVVNVATFG